MTRCYLITVDSKSKSTFFLEHLERILPTILEASSNKSSHADIRHLDIQPKELLTLLEKDGIKMSEPLSKLSPFTFESKTSKW
jgi:hypothetical protein